MTSTIKRPARLGLVTEVVPRAELRARAHEIAASIAARNPIAIQGTIRAIWESLDMTRGAALATPAGIVDFTPFMDVDVATFRRVYDVNVIGTYLCIREAAKRMRPGGRICAVASVAGKRGGGLTGTAAYAASKGAVLALVRNAARALASSGIAVNCVAPGATITPMLAEAFSHAEQRQRVESMIPLNRSGEPREIAEAIAWLLSPRASYVHGETLTVDGGLVMD